MSDVHFPFTISGYNEVGDEEAYLFFDRRPEKCPICHHAILAESYSCFLNRKLEFGNTKILQVVFRCPRESCRNIFLGYYSSTALPHAFKFSGNLEPIVFEERAFSIIINKISPKFIKIYNQALEAEKRELLLIYGAGYRKALEFLIKDYLKAHATTEEEKKEIENKMLGQIIKEKLNHPELKAVSQRAVWLGNDETHYIRVWENKDIEDLKELIDLTIDWVQMTVRTKHLLEEDMPKGK